MSPMCIERPFCAARKAKKSTSAPMPTIALPAIRTTISAR